MTMRDKEPYCAVKLKDNSSIVARKLEVYHDQKLNYCTAHEINSLLMVYRGNVYGEVVAEVPHFRDAVRIAHSLNVEHSRWRDDEDIDEDILQEKWVEYCNKNGLDHTTDPRTAILDKKIRTKK